MKKKLMQFVLSKKFGYVMNSRIWNIFPMRIRRWRWELWEEVYRRVHFPVSKTKPRPRAVDRVKMALAMQVDIDWLDDVTGKTGTVTGPFELVDAMAWVTENRDRMQETYPGIRFQYRPR